MLFSSYNYIRKNKRHFFEFFCFLNAKCMIYNVWKMLAQLCTLMGKNSNGHRFFYLIYL